MFEFAGTSVPGYRVQWVDGPITADGSGEPVEVAGDASSRSSWSRPRASTSAHRLTIVYEGPDRIAGAGQTDAHHRPRPHRRLRGGAQLGGRHRRAGAVPGAAPLTEPDPPRDRPRSTPDPDARLRVSAMTARRMPDAHHAERWRVEPGSKLHGSTDIDTRSKAGAPGDKAATDGDRRRARRRARRAAEPALGRGHAVAADRAPGHGRRRQGRHDPQGVHRREPAGRAGGIVQGADAPRSSSHDFLWRIHQQAPAHGEIGVFNRSHYEDVLIVRVDELVPEKVWRARYDAHPRLRGARSPRRAPRSSSSSCTSRRTSRPSGSRPASTTRRSAGSSPPPTSTSASKWDDYQEAYAGRDRARPAPTTRPGT